MTIIRPALAVVVGLAALTVPATAQELYGTLKKVRDTKVLTIGYREASIPFSYYDNQKKPVGFALELCNHITAEVKKELKMPNLEVRYIPVNAQTRIPLITNGTIDIECGSIANTLARQQQVDFTNPIYFTGTRLLVGKTSGIKEVEDLKGKSVAFQVGGTEERFWKDYVAKTKLNVRVLHVRDFAEGMLALESERVDAFMAIEVFLFGLLAKSAQKDRFELTGRILVPEITALMVRRDDSAFRLIANRTLAGLYRSGEVYPLFKKHFEPAGIPLTPDAEATFRLNSIPD